MYKCILADPPWYMQGGGVCKRGADKHYALLKTPEIIHTILKAPEWIPANDAHLWLWVTNNFLKDGLHVMQALGFRYITNVVWVKPHFGTGQYIRGQHELLLFGVKGRLPSLSRSIGSVISAKPSIHSKKPEESFKLIEGISPGPRIEFFSRCRREGWDYFGNQII